MLNIERQTDRDKEREIKKETDILTESCRGYEEIFGFETHIEPDLIERETYVHVHVDRQIEGTNGRTEGRTDRHINIPDKVLPRP